MAVLERTEQNMIMFVNAKLAMKYGIGKYMVSNIVLLTENKCALKVKASKPISKKVYEELSKYVKQISAAFNQEVSQTTIN